MSEENATTAAEDNQETYTKEKVEALVKKRLAKQGERFEREKAELLAQMPQSQAPQMQNPEMPETAASPEMPQGSAAAQEMPAQQGAFNPQAFQQILNDNNQKMLQQLEDIRKAQDAALYFKHHLHKFLEDKKFRELVENSTHGGTIDEVTAAQIVNQATPDRAKKILSDLLSNETMYLKMKNAKHENRFNEWLQKAMNSTPMEGGQQSTVPDLASESLKEGDDSREDNFTRHMSRY